MCSLVPAAGRIACLPACVLQDGVTSTSDPQWTDKWQDVYMSHKSLQLPFYACLGNHDYIENPQAQVRLASCTAMCNMWLWLWLLLL